MERQSSTLNLSSGPSTSGSPQAYMDGWRTAGMLYALAVRTLREARHCGSSVVEPKFLWLRDTRSA